MKLGVEVPNEVPIPVHLEEVYNRIFTVSRNATRRAMSLA